MTAAVPSDTRNLAPSGGSSGLASVGSVGDAYDHALAESFVDSFKTELIRHRVWRTRTQLELAVVEYVSRYDHARPHQSLGYLPRLEYEHQHAPKSKLSAPSIAA